MERTVLGRTSAEDTLHDRYIRVMRAELLTHAQPRHQSAYSWSQRGGHAMLGTRLGHPPDIGLRDPLETESARDAPTNLTHTHLPPARKSVHNTTQHNTGLHRTSAQHTCA